MSVDNKKARTLEGKVVSNKMDKTAVVAVVRRGSTQLVRSLPKPLALKFMMPTMSVASVIRFLFQNAHRFLQKSWQLVSIVEKHRD